MLAKLFWNFAWKRNFPQGRDESKKVLFFRLDRNNNFHQILFADRKSSKSTGVLYSIFSRLSVFAVSAFFFISHAKRYGRNDTEEIDQDFRCLGFIDSRISSSLSAQKSRNSNRSMSFFGWTPSYNFRPIFSPFTCDTIIELPKKNTRKKRNRNFVYNFCSCNFCFRRLFVVIS